MAAAALTLAAGCATAVPVEKVGAFPGDPAVTVSAALNGSDLTVNLSASCGKCPGGTFKVFPADQASSPHVWGEGHYHVFLDVLPTPPGSPIPKGPGIFHVSTPSFVIHGVTSGQHHLYVELGFSDHIPYQNTVQLLAFSGGVGAPQKIAAAPTPTPVASAAAAAPTSSAQGPVAATVQLLADPTNGGKFNPARQDTWVFGSQHTGFYLRKFAWTPIVRHRMVAGTASPDDPALTAYWAHRPGPARSGRGPSSSSSCAATPRPTRSRRSSTAAGWNCGRSSATTGSTSTSPRSRRAWSATRRWLSGESRSSS